MLKSSFHILGYLNIHILAWHNMEKTNIIYASVRFNLQGVHGEDCAKYPMYSYIEVKKINILNKYKKNLLAQR